MSLHAADPAKNPNESMKAHTKRWLDALRKPAKEVLMNWDVPPVHFDLLTAATFGVYLVHIRDQEGQYLSKWMYSGLRSAFFHLFRYFSIPQSW